MSALAIEWTGVSVVAGRTPIVHDVTVDVPTGAWLSLVGPNGAGKTTLLRTLQEPKAATGDIGVLGTPAASLSARERARRLAVVPQHPVIPPGMRVFDYVLLGRTPHQGFRLAPSRDDRHRVVAVLQRLDLERFSDRSVDTLSGGERQRVVLARALVQDTPILVLDEPTASLDVGHQLEVLELVADLRLERDLTVLTTVHDLTIAGQFADRVAVLSGGRLVASGAPADVLTPATIARHWGVDVECATDEAGAVTVTVRRRRVGSVRDRSDASPRSGSPGWS